MDSTGFNKHDHHACIQDAISVAEEHCETRNIQFTKIRRRVLEILLEQHKSMGAYDILAVLNSEGLGSQPPAVYRALDFLVSNGFAHKIEKKNAYIACSHSAENHTPAFMICRVCDTVAELQVPETSGILAGAANQAGFTIEKTVVEAEGICPSCQGKA